jgi:transglutaminase-like putative cysteine protease
MQASKRNNMLWVIATFTLALVPQLLRMPPAVAAMALLPLAWRVAAEINGWKPLPALVRHSLTVMGLAALFFSYGDLSGRRAAVSLLAVMLSMKLIECYRVRDARLVVSFSLFLCATQFLFAQGVMMPVYGAVTVIMALATLTRLQRAEAWGYQDRTAPPVRTSLFSELGFSLKLLAVALPTGLAFFMLFPRLASPLWGIPETTLDAKTGLSDSMSPGSIQQMFMDDSPAFRVTFDGEIPGQKDLYWRGPVFWNYDGRTWEDSFYSRSLLAERTPQPSQDAWSYTVTLEPNERKWLFALDYPVNRLPDSRLTVDFQIIRRDPVIQLHQYSMMSNPDFVDTPELPVTLRNQALSVPEGLNPETREQVERWRRETPNDRAFVQRVLTWFNQEPFHYSLEAPLLGRHAVDDFLFDTRTGYCEHYASAFAVMMRMAGIPARVVTGYQGGWYNALGDYVLVRQSDAHAWVEIWQPGLGWTREDPTAAVSPARVQRGSLDALPSPRHALDFAWLRSLRNGVDIAQQRWNDWVIEYGAEKQARLLSPLGFERLTPSMLVLILFTVIAIFSAIIFPLVLRLKGPTEKDPVRKAWRTFTRRLASAGFEASPAAGPMETAAQAARALPADASAIRKVAGLYSQSCYSPRPPSLQRLKKAVSDFRPAKKSAKM